MLGDSIKCYLWAEIFFSGSRDQRSFNYTRSIIDSGIEIGTARLLTPRMTTGQRNAIASPATGLIIYNTSTNIFNYFNGSIWIDLLNTSTGVTAVNGTLNRISVGGTPTAPVIDIDANYAGQSTINTLGTITSGTWKGTTIVIANGGTGQTTATNAFNALSPMTTLGDIIYGGAGGTGTRLAGNITITPMFLKQTGTGAASSAPVWVALGKNDVGLNNVENTALSGWAGSSNITTLGIIGTGTWNSNIITGQYGGTGIANTGKTITLGGNFTTTPGNAVTFTTTAATNVSLPASGTLATLTGTEILTNKTITAATNTISGLTNANLSGSAGITDAKPSDNINRW